MNDQRFPGSGALIERVKLANGDEVALTVWLDSAIRFQFVPVTPVCDVSLGLSVQEHTVTTTRLLYNLVFCVSRPESRWDRILDPLARWFKFVNRWAAWWVLKRLGYALVEIRPANLGRLPLIRRAIVYRRSDRYLGGGMVLMYPHHFSAPVLIDPGDRLSCALTWHDTGDCVCTVELRGLEKAPEGGD